MNNANCFLKIPMVGFTESLNISVSAAIILQDVTQKLRSSDIKWQLTETEKLQKRFDWCKKTITSFEKILEHYLIQQ
jgi:tRNA (guanosine-2'-O-)-methyltransferase